MAIDKANVLDKAISVRLPSLMRADNNSGQGDNGFITGKVTENAIGVKRRVRCYHRLSGILVDEVWSNNNGDYTIINLVAGVRYYITSLDQNGDLVQYNAVTQDLIIASEVIK